MQYDLDQLNDKEFEELCTDLLGAYLNQRFERFGKGPDGGVDGRFFGGDGKKEVILQCKHYLKTGYAGLVSKLKKDESKKVGLLKPERYIFITSLSLTRKKKKELALIFSPYIKSESDIFGQEDIMQLLESHEAVVHKHFKLWLSSTTVLKRILHNAVIGRSEDELARINRNKKIYVETCNHSKALEKIEKFHILIISGEPGVGKTTLGENLCLYFATAKGYEFLDIENSITEAEEVFDKKKKQLFYFDDFLGGNYLEAIEDNKDSHIVKFIERVKNNKNKIFILTSRTNILNSGVLYSRLFGYKNIRDNELLLTIKELTPLDKAKILYNHIWFSDLPEEYVEEIYKEKRYLKIVKHKNFNPRLIAFITDIGRIQGEATEYWEYIERTLSNPRDIWRDSFNNQSDEFIRNLVRLTTYNGGHISEEDLREAFVRLNELENLKNTSHVEKNFRSSTELATKSFLNRSVLIDQVVYSLFNPSIGDFILHELEGETKKITNIFKALKSIDSLKHLQAINLAKILSDKDFSKICLEILKSTEQETDYDYSLALSKLCLGNKHAYPSIIDLLKKITLEEPDISEIDTLLKLLTQFKEELDLKSIDFLENCINIGYLNETEMESLAEFLEENDIIDGTLHDLVKESFEHYLSRELRNTQGDVDISGLVSASRNGIGEEDIEYDEDLIEERLYSYVTDIIDQFPSEKVREYPVNMDKVLRSVDIGDMASKHIRNASEPPFDEEGYGFKGGSYLNHDQDIDDLFDRT